MPSNTAPALDVAAIRARAEAATPGPWRRGYYEATQSFREIGAHTAIGYGEKGALLASCGAANDPQSEADADFVAHARTDIPALLAHVAQLAVENAALRADAARLDWIEAAGSPLRYVPSERIVHLAWDAHDGFRARLDKIIAQNTALARPTADGGTIDA